MTVVVMVTMEKIDRFGGLKTRGLSLTSSASQFSENATPVSAILIIRTLPQKWVPAFWETRNPKTLRTSRSCILIPKANCSRLCAPSAWGFYSPCACVRKNQAGGVHVNANSKVLRLGFLSWPACIRVVGEVELWASGLRPDLSQLFRQVPQVAPRHSPGSSGHPDLASLRAVRSRQKPSEAVRS